MATGPAPGTGPRLAASARPGSIRQSTRPCAHCPTGQTRVAEASMGLQALPLPARHPVPQRAAVRLEQRDSKFLGERGVQHTGPPARPRKGLRKCQFISCPPQGCHVALTGHCRWADGRTCPPPLPPPRPRRPPLQAPSAPPSPSPACADFGIRVATAPGSVPASPPAASVQAAHVVTPFLKAAGK